MDDELKAEIAHAEREATEAARELTGKPEQKKYTIGWDPAESARIDLRDRLACAFAAGGLHPEEIYAAADEALRHRDV